MLVGSAPAERRPRRSAAPPRRATGFPRSVGGVKEGTGTAWERGERQETTSGSAPRSLLAQSQMPMPAVQCRMAWSMVSHWGAGCLPATTTLT
jgi:hypothetical protein